MDLRAESVLPATRAGTLATLPARVPSSVVGATLAALLVGTRPAFDFAFALCRRHLRRRAGSTTEIA